MKLCLVNIVLMILMTSYKGMVDGRKIKRSPGVLERAAGEGSKNCPPGQEPTTTDPVSCRPCDQGHHKDSAGPWPCRKCRPGTVSNEDRRFCVEALSRAACSMAFALPGGRIRPADKYYMGQWEEMNDEDFDGMERTCLDKCRWNERCRNAVYKASPEYKKFACDSYNISLHELRAAGKQSEIVTVGDEDLWPIVSIMDRVCDEIFGTKCMDSYTESDSSEIPDLMYNGRFGLRYVSTGQQCKAKCSENDHCRSAVFYRRDHGSTCPMYEISVQNLREIGRPDEIDTSTVEHITYDRVCGISQGSSCSDQFPTKYDRMNPDMKTYLIGRYVGDKTFTNCTTHCIAEKPTQCRSVLYYQFHGMHYCKTFSVSISDLIITHRRLEISDQTDMYTYPEWYTMDRKCVLHHNHQ